MSANIHNVDGLPKWAQRRISELEERVKRAESTLPWTKPGMEWFTLFWPGPEPKARVPQRLFTCGEGGTHCVCTLGPQDWIFIGRGKAATGGEPSNKVTTSECHTPDCPYCSGEACNLCGAGCWSDKRNCDHDVIDRHAGLNKVSPVAPPLLIGKWPGDETEEQLLDALDKHRNGAAPGGEVKL